MRRLPPLSSLRAFEAAARLASFKGAAAELAVTPTAVSHHIRALEQHLGLRLFERQVRKVQLTGDGALLYVGLREGFDAIERSVQAVRRAPLRRPLTLTTTPAFASRWLLPRLPGLKAEVAEVDLHLHASDDVLDLRTGGADLAIRYGPGIYPGFVAETLLEDVFAPIAHPALAVATAEDLEAAPLLRFDWRNPHPAHPTWDKWFAAARLRRRPGAPQAAFSDESHAIQAALAGHGVALVSLVLLQQELKAGLVRQVPGPILPGFTYHLVHAPDAADRLVGLKRWLHREAASGRHPPR